MARKGLSGTSMGAYETSAAWNKRQRKKAKRFDARCKRLSGSVRTRMMTPEEWEAGRRADDSDS
ncbi:hypothetical protein [Ellagibacter sp.]|uniref:hypothetical protein n=1 Tax=Ellagibacter sp. TaxID=2137578 RepID=UPI003AB5235E